MMRMIRTQAQRGGKGEKRGKGMEERCKATVNKESSKVILSIIILIILIVLIVLIVQITFIIVIRGRM
jgi:t-SNARE complex subunit (syntaxin)